MAMIMVADDEPDVADLFATVLASAGHTVHTAPDGPTALERITELRPDLCVLDHYMPQLTGLEVAHRLRADPATAAVPLLMISASAPPTALLYCNVVLAKPVSLEHFRTVVEELLGPPVPHDSLRDVDRVRATSALLDAYTDRTAERLRGLAAETAEAVGADMAAVNLVLIDAVAVCGAYGLDGWIEEAGGMPAEWAPCTTVVRTGARRLVDDLRDDPAVAGTPLVTVNRALSYAGTPLVDAAGHVVGTLCVFGRRPGAFTAATLDELDARAPEVMKIAAP